MAFFPTEQLGGTRKKAALRALPPLPASDWRPPATLPDLRDAALMAFDVETYDPDLVEHGPGWSRGRGHIVGVSIGALSRHGDRWAGYLPLRHTVAPETNMPTGEALAWVKAMLETPSICKTGANLLYDVGWLAEEGIQVQGKLYDVQFAEILLHERNKVSLEVLGRKYCGQGKESSVLYDWCAQAYGGAPTSAQRANIYRSPPSLTGAYAESDATLPIDILQKQWPLLYKDGLIDVFELECASIPMLVAMRQAGITIDLDKVDQLHIRYKKLIDELYGTLRSDYDFRGSINSSRDLAKLFDTVGIKYGVTADGNPSITKNYLQMLDHPVAKIIQDVREYDKLRSTFIEGSIKSNHVNGVVHCSFHPLRNDSNGTITGRMSSSQPNLQQIPSRTKEGQLIRKVFTKDNGHAFILKLDYSQIEYRMLAHFACGCGSDDLRHTYCTNADADYHDIVQNNVKLLTRIEIERKPIKTINFGLLYGSGEKKLAVTAGFTSAQAKTVFKAYHEGATYVLPTMEAIAEEAQQNGYITTILGRRTHFDLFEPTGYKHTGVPLPYHAAVAEYGLSLKRAGTYKGVNYKFQGSAADVMKVAMAKLSRSGVFAVTGVPRLTVHDELVFSLPTGGREMLEAIHYIQHVMETAITFRIPLKAEPEIGPNWGNVTELKGNERWMLAA
jgi:DNA polymerase I-like protein with 3'-5' exonuclease and polymerase domains